MFDLDEFHAIMDHFSARKGLEEVDIKPKGCIMPVADLRPEVIDGRSLPSDVDIRRHISDLPVPRDERPDRNKKPQG